jgi:hypothetical protein
MFNIYYVFNLIIRFLTVSTCYFHLIFAKRRREIGQQSTVIYPKFEGITALQSRFIEIWDDIKFNFSISSWWCGVLKDRVGRVWLSLRKSSSSNSTE